MDEYAFWDDPSWYDSIGYDPASYTPSNLDYVDTSFISPDYSWANVDYGDFWDSPAISVEEPVVYTGPSMDAMLRLRADPYYSGSFGPGAWNVSAIDSGIGLDQPTPIWQRGSLTYPEVVDFTVPTTNWDQSFKEHMLVPGGYKTQTYVLNDEGDVAGYVDDSGRFRRTSEPSGLEKLGELASSAVGKLIERPLQQGTQTIKRNPDGSITVGGQRQPSALEQILKTLGLIYPLTKKNPKTGSARASTVQNIGPQAVAARPVSSTVMRAKDGGKVELPKYVKGGLLPLTMKIAELLMAQQQGEEAPRHKGLIGGEDSGQEDNVEALLSPGEYVIDAEIVSALGDGNTDAGAKKLDEMRYNIRKHKRSGGLAQIAPKAKSPEKYMKG